mmetsp:Transcript_19731/g.36737  ORF Transcript_19731/g.36737 Transcript_19731/m.36737 type:complete len:838 (-) Transcript_19731:225-2738(-)
MSDPLDSDDFDPIDFINRHFPSEASLVELDTFMVGISSKISGLDDEISRAVQGQSRAGEQATRDITDAQIAINELFGKIHDIKTKASQSEKMVQEICSDIKKLDCAKNHLQSTITSLKRLQMLITAVSQLELMASEMQYREVANLLDAVKQLMTHFDKYTAVPKVAEIKSNVDAIQHDLRRHVHHAFREIGQLVDTVADSESLSEYLPGNMKSLSDACLVVDALGPMARKDLLDEFVQLQLLPYEKIFSAGQSHYGLDHVERRWAWIKRLVRTIDSKFGSICPKHWRLAQRLCLSFNERTKVHMVAMLTDFGDNSDVTQLLRALQTTLRFEQEMRSRFQEEAIPVSDDQLSPFSPREKDPSTYSDERSQLEGKSGPLPSSEKPLIYLPQEPDVAITNEETSILGKLMEPNCISKVFEQFLGPYVLLERRNLEEMLYKLRLEEGVTTEGTDGSSCSGSVYGSSISMFVYIKNSIKRCTALTTGPTFLSLSNEFRTCLQNYAESLRSRCPPATGQPPVFKMPAGSEVTLSYIINTSEYCSEVVPQLEQMVQQKMNEDLQERVVYDLEVDAFMDVLAHALSALQHGAMYRLESAFKTMANVNWASNTLVGEESSYVHQWHSTLQTLLGNVRDSLSDTYFRNFCTKLAAAILQRYLDIIMKQKRISESSTQQLLLDTYNIKTMLLQLHHLGLPADSAQDRIAVPPMYMKLIASKIAHIEVILKLIGTPEDMVLERFKIMWPDGTPSDLQAIMTLQGVKKQDQQVYLEQFGLDTGKYETPDEDGEDVLDSKTHPTSGQTIGGTSATATNMANSVRSVTQDLSSSTRSAIGDLTKSFKFGRNN